MNQETITAWLAAIIRHVLAGFFVWLMATTGVSEHNVTTTVSAVSGFIVVIGWSLVQKYFKEKTIERALELPAGSPRKRLKERR